MIPNILDKKDSVYLMIPGRQKCCLGARLLLLYVNIYTRYFSEDICQCLLRLDVLLTAMRFELYNDRVSIVVLFGQIDDDDDDDEVGR